VIQAKRKKKKKQTQADINNKADKNQDRIPEDEILNPAVLKYNKSVNPDQETETNQGLSYIYLHNIYI